MEVLRSFCGIPKQEHVLEEQDCHGVSKAYLHLFVKGFFSRVGLPRSAFFLWPLFLFLVEGKRLVSANNIYLFEVRYIGTANHTSFWYDFSKKPSVLYLHLSIFFRHSVLLRLPPPPGSVPCAGAMLALFSWRGKSWHSVSSGGHVSVSGRIRAVGGYLMIGIYVGAVCWVISCRCYMCPVWGEFFFILHIEGGIPFSPQLYISSSNICPNISRNLHVGSA